MPRRKQMPNESPLFLTPLEAAALDRLLDAYIRTETDDPGMAELESVRRKVIGIGQDHTTYVKALSSTAASAERSQIDAYAVATAEGRPACSCCGRRVAPLGDDNRCGHCGANRSAGTHVGDQPCRTTGSKPDGGDVR